MRRLTIANNVRVTLNAGITDAATSITVNAATAPNQNPPAPSGGAPGVLTLVDSLSTPSKIEIITYTGVTGSGGTRTLTGCSRGQDGTTAQSWSAGAHLFCAPTRALVDPSNVLLSDLGAHRTSGGSQTLTLDWTQPAAVLDVSRYHTFFLKLRTNNVNNGDPAEIPFPVTITGLSVGDRASVIFVIKPLDRTPALSPAKSFMVTLPQYPDTQSDLGAGVGTGATYVYQLTFFGGPTTFALSGVGGSAPGDPFGMDP